MRKINQTITLIILAIFSSSISAAVVYVKPNAESAAWGSKQNVYTNLQEAINNTVSGDEIWVAAGTYYTTTDYDRDKYYELNNPVKIYGGFNGTETSIEERNWVVNKTILSGNIGDKTLK